MFLVETLGFFPWIYYLPIFQELLIEIGNLLTLVCNVNFKFTSLFLFMLGHKNIRMFITHAGGFSTQEAVYHGVPRILLPIFVDQNLNSYQAVSKGYGIELEILDLNEKVLEKAIREILNNKT